MERDKNNGILSDDKDDDKDDDDASKTENNKSDKVLNDCKETEPHKEKHELLKELLEEEKQLDDRINTLVDAAIQRENTMKALHDYNDIKDATQIVLGQLAELYGDTVKELHEKFELIDK